MQTYIPNQDRIEKKWYLIDASGAVLGRLASRAAEILMGKNKPIYTPFLDTGDFLVIINAEKIRLTGRKLDDKLYRWHTGYMGGLKQLTARELLRKNPTRIVEEAVAGMLPKNKLGKKMVKKLKVYVGSTHPHTAQNPSLIEV